MLFSSSSLQIALLVRPQAGRHGSCTIPIMKTHWITVALFHHQQPGEALVAYLREQRMEARTYDDKLLRRLLFLRPPRVTFQVQVRENYHKMAVNWLSQNPPAILGSAIHCPACGSLRVSYPQMTRRFVLPTLFLHLGIILRIVQHQAYCESCHHIWSLPDSEPAKVLTPRAADSQLGHR
jgi:hypothetical protein